MTLSEMMQQTQDEMERQQSADSSIQKIPMASSNVRNEAETGTDMLESFEREANSASAAAVSDAEIIEMLAEAITQGDGLWIDSEGKAFADDIDGNSTRVKPYPFAGEPLSDADVTRLLGDAIVNGDPTWLEPDGTINLENENENASAVLGKGFAGEPLSDAELTRILGDAIVNGDETWMGPDGTIYVENEENATAQARGDFAAVKPLTAMPAGHEEQWYKKNPNLFKKEVLFMKKKHPDARFGFYPQSGDMFWQITLKIADFCEPWTFLLRYMKDHPNNKSFGGSVRVMLINSPSEEKIKERAAEAHRPGVPHLLHATESENYTYLCTREPTDVHSGEKEITSAVQVATWAADWALHFELGLRRKDVWNKFCGETHFKCYQVK